LRPRSRGGERVAAGRSLLRRRSRRQFVGARPCDRETSAWQESLRGAQREDQRCSRALPGSACDRSRAPFRRNRRRCRGVHLVQIVHVRGEQRGLAEACAMRIEAAVSHDPSLTFPVSEVGGLRLSLLVCRREANDCLGLRRSAIATADCGRRFYARLRQLGSGPAGLANAVLIVNLTSDVHTHCQQTVALTQ
jgi:hypothetical protein